jgi:hypothetical protein
MLSLNIETGNAAFDADGGGLNAESARILRHVADRVEAGQMSGNVRDINGNTVGSFELTED